MPGTQLLLGKRYAIVRPEIRRVRQVRAQEPAQPFRAMVALGEDDAEGFTIKVIRLLLPMTRVSRIDVVARQHHACLPALQELAAAHPDRLELASEPAEIASASCSLPFCDHWRRRVVAGACLRRRPAADRGRV